MACSDSGDPLGGLVVIRTPGTFDSGSFAATEMAPSAVDGDPTRYWLGPALPAEATTMMPALAAFVAASASGVSLVPKSEPSDMLITSMSWSTAHSIASTTTSVGPAQPN